MSKFYPNQSNSGASKSGMTPIKFMKTEIDRQEKEIRDMLDSLDEAKETVVRIQASIVEVEADLAKFYPVLERLKRLK